MKLEIPRGFVYGSFTEKLRKTHFHIVLETDERGFYKDILYVGSKGMKAGTLIIYRSESYVLLRRIEESLRKRKVFMLTEYQFDHFKDFFKVSNFIESNLFDYYPHSTDLTRSTIELEDLVNQNQ